MLNPAAPPCRGDFFLKAYLAINIPVCLPGIKSGIRFRGSNHSQPADCAKTPWWASERAILVNGTVARRRLKNSSNVGGGGGRQQQQHRGKPSSTGSSSTAAERRKTQGWETASGGRRSRGRETSTGAYVTVVRVNCSSGEEGEGDDKEKIRCVDCCDSEISPKQFECLISQEK